eukprot:969554-Pyramimonas_sp.AAC.1
MDWKLADRCLYSTKRMKPAPGSGTQRNAVGTQSEILEYTNERALGSSGASGEPSGGLGRR